MKDSDGGLCFGSELSYQGPVLDGLVLGHGGTNSDTPRIYDDNTLHSFVSVDSIQCFFYFLRHIELKLFILNLKIIFTSRPDLVITFHFLFCSII